LSRCSSDCSRNSSIGSRCSSASSFHGQMDTRPSPLQCIPRANMQCSPYYASPYGAPASPVY
jgi:hypothetical protein